MIFDRTSTDVNKAINIRKNKVQQGIELTEEEVLQLERGSITINTINRIEQKQQELKNLLDNMFYFVEPIETKIWNENEFFFDTDLQKIVNNTAILRKAFYTYAKTPANPRAEYHYRELNSMEKILYDLETMIDYVKANYKECGNYECGE